MAISENNLKTKEDYIKWSNKKQIEINTLNNDIQQQILEFNLIKDKIESFAKQIATLSVLAKSPGVRSDNKLTGNINNKINDYNKTLSELTKEETKINTHLNLFRINITIPNDDQAPPKIIPLTFGQKFANFFIGIARRFFGSKIELYEPTSKKDYNAVETDINGKIRNTKSDFARLELDKRLEPLKSKTLKAEKSITSLLTSIQNPGEKVVEKLDGDLKKVGDKKDEAAERERERAAEVASAPVARPAQAQAQAEVEAKAAEAEKAAQAEAKAEAEAAEKVKAAQAEAEAKAAEAEAKAAQAEAKAKAAQTEAEAEAAEKAKAAEAQAEPAPASQLVPPGASSAPANSVSPSPSEALAASAEAAPVAPPPIAPPSIAPSALLEAIRKGKELKKADPQKKVDLSAPEKGIAQILARRGAIKGTEGEDDDDDEDLDINNELDGVAAEAEAKAKAAEAKAKKAEVFSGGAGAPAPKPDRGGLLESIQKGIKLKKADPKEKVDPSKIDPPKIVDTQQMFSMLQESTKKNLQRFQQKADKDADDWDEDEDNKPKPGSGG